MRRTFQAGLVPGWAKLCLVAAMATYMGSGLAAPRSIALIADLTGSADASDAPARNLDYAILRANAAAAAKQGKSVKDAEPVLTMQRYDAQGKKQEALAALRTAVADGHRVVLQGTIAGTGAALAQWVRERNQRFPNDPVLLLSFSPMASDAGVTCDANTVELEAGASQRAQAISASLIADAGAQNIALMAPGTRYGMELLTAVKKQIWAQKPYAKVVADLVYPMDGVQDFGLYLKRIRASGAQAVVLGAQGQELATLIDGLAKEGYTGSVYSSHEVPQQATNQLRRLRLTQLKGWNETLAKPEDKEIAKGFFQREPGMRPDQFSWTLQKTVATLIESSSDEPGARAARFRGLGRDKTLSRVQVAATGEDRQVSVSIPSQGCQ